MTARSHQITFGDVVDVGRVNQSLKELRKQAAAEAKDPVASRVCTINLAAFCHRREARQEAMSVLGEVVVEHPGRMFVVDVDHESAGTGVEARVSVDGTSPSPGFSPAYSEIISLHAQGAAIEHLPSVLVSLLDPDQPACAWWVDTPGFGRTWERITQGADRVVVDSGGMDPWDLMRLAEYVRSDTFGSASDDHAALGDLSWARIKPFQAQCARFFDAPRIREAVATLEEVTVRYVPAKEPCTAIGPALLGAWVRDRLRKCGQRARQRLEVRVRLLPDARTDLAPGEVTSVLIKGGGLALSVSRPVGLSEYAVGEALAGAPDLSPQHLKVRTGDKSWLLAQELQVFSRDLLFESCLVQAVDILRDARKK